MASSTYDFTLNRNQIVNAALRKLGVLGLTESPTAEMTANASEALNAMLKSWQSRGVLLSTESWQKIDLVSGTATYDLATEITDDDVFNIRQAYVRQGTGDSELDIISQAEYGRINVKTTSGTPFALVINRTTSPSVTLFPVPNSSTDDLYILCEEKLADMDSATASIPLESFWLNALIYGLAVEVGPEYGVISQIFQFLVQKAEREFRMAKSKTNNERVTYPHLAPSY